MPDPTPDREKLREALAKLTPERRAHLEERVSHAYAATGREVVQWVTKNGIRFPTFSQVLHLPAPPGFTGPRVLKVVIPDQSPDDEEDD